MNKKMKKLWEEKKLIGQSKKSVKYTRKNQNYIIVDTKKKFSKNECEDIGEIKKINKSNYNKRWRYNHKEHIKNKSKIYYNKNKTKIQKYLRKWKMENKDTIKKYLLNFRYGITIEEYDNLYSTQQGMCKICKEKIYKWGNGNKQTVANVDHCHLTGKIRGMLCSKCNRILGIVNDDINRLKSCINYLKIHKKYEN